MTTIHYSSPTRSVRCDMSPPLTSTRKSNHFKYTDLGPPPPSPYQYYYNDSLVLARAMQDVARPRRRRVTRRFLDSYESRFFVFLLCKTCVGDGRPAGSPPPVASPPPHPWPLHDIVLLRSFCARINHPFIAPPTCIARTIAMLLHVYRAIYDAPRPPICMPCTISYWQ